MSSRPARTRLLGVSSRVKVHYTESTFTTLERLVDRIVCESSSSPEAQEPR
jgi:hypothetical protein